MITTELTLLPDTEEKFPQKAIKPYLSNPMIIVNAVGDEQGPHFDFLIRYSSYVQEKTRKSKKGGII